VAKKRVAILTTFQDFDPAYSLTNIALDQCRMLAKHGYEYSMFVNQGFNVEHLNKYSDLNIQDVLPTTPGISEDIVIDHLVDALTDSYFEHLSEYDVIMTHDLMFQSWFLTHNKAVRNVIPKIPNARWLHWVHSAPGGRPKVGYPKSLRYNKAPNSKYVYLNHDDRLRFAEYIGGNTEDVRIVYNPMDLRDFHDMSKDTRDLIDAHDLMSADIVQVYPFSSTRMKEKGVDKIIKIFASFKKHYNKSVRVIFCNAHCTKAKEHDSVQQMVDLAAEHGLSEDEVIFTSRYRSERPEDGGWTYSTPYHVVKELMLISNMFVFPTVSEACSKVLLEASAAGTYLILNSSFKPLKEFGGTNALYHDFGSLRETVDFGDSEDNWLAEVGKASMPGFLSSKPLQQKTRIRQEFNIDYIFKHQLEPLFYEEW